MNETNFHMYLKLHGSATKYVYQTMYAVVLQGVIFGVAKFCWGHGDDLPRYRFEAFQSIRDVGHDKGP